MSLFCISIVLTQKGVNAIGLVLGFVFKYMQVMQDMTALQQQYVETGHITNTLFRYMEKQNTATYVSAIASRMHSMPLRFILNTTPFRDFDKEHVQSLLRLLTPSNCIGLFSTKMNVMTHIPLSVDPIYGTHYGKHESPRSPRDGE